MFCVNVYHRMSSWITSNSNDRLQHFVDRSEFFKERQGIVVDFSRCRVTERIKMKVATQVSLKKTCQKQRNLASVLHRAHSLSNSGSSLKNFSMSDCYEKLKEIVPTIPRDRKVSRVEILQHVIDYIQDLQTALDNQNIRVKGFNENTQVAVPNRTPFSTLQSTSSSGATQLPLLMTSQPHHSLSREFVKQMTCSSMGQKLHPYETPESSPESQPCTC